MKYSKKNAVNYKKYLMRLLRLTKKINPIK